MRTLEARDIIKRLEYNNGYAVCIDEPNNRYCTTFVVMDENLEDEIWESSDFAEFSADERPEVYELLADAIKEEFKPVNGVWDDSYDQMLADLEAKKFSILYYKHDDACVYILVW